MASIIAKLLTYKFLTFPEIFDNLFNQSAHKLVLWTFLLLLMICLPIYMLFRNTARESLLKGNEGDKYPEVYSLLDCWRKQNYWIVDKLIEICMAFVSGPPGSTLSPLFNANSVLSEKIEISKNDFSRLTEDLIRNAHQIWPNAHALLNEYPHLKLLYQKKALHFTKEIETNFDEDAINDEDCLVDRESFSSIQPNTISSNTVATGELHNTVEEISGQHQHSQDNPPSSRSCSPAPQAEDIITQNGDGSITNETTESIEGGTSGMVVLAHNPGLKQKLASTRVRPPFLRSASDYEKAANASSEELGVDLQNERLAEPETVPLDPIVHPPSSEVEELAETATGPIVNRSANSSQRRHRTAVNDISPHHERVSTTLSSKNLLVRVVKADFIDLRESTSRGYAEIHLADLLSSTSGALGGTELMRTIPLEVKHQTSSAGGKWEHAQSPISSMASLTICKPSVTAEFHFMERIMEDPFSVCKGRASLNSPTAARKRRSSLAAVPDSAQQNYELGGPSSSGSIGSAKASTGSREKDTADPTANEGNNQDGNHSNPLSRSTSVRGSRLFEPAFENLREPGPVAASVLSRTRPSPRSFMSPRLSLSTSRRATSAVVGKPNGMGLLGPSSQLAGMVASLTAASADVETTVDPSTAAAVASAVAVAAATGGLHAGSSSSGAGPTTDGAPRWGRGNTTITASAAAEDSLFDQDLTAETGGAGSGGDQTLVNRILSSAEQQQPVVRYTAPAANIAESLGTYSAQSHHKRTDASPSGLMKLFKQKKKPTNSPNVAKLMYLENLETSEFDTISTEGYQRILKGERMYQDDAS